MTDVVCATCGKLHPAEEAELTFRLPDAIHSLAVADREARCHISSDICALDEERFFVRGLVPIPVSGRDRPYCIGAWAEIPECSFNTIYELWDDPDQAAAGPFAGVLANAVSEIGSPAGLPVEVRLTGPTTRPEFRVLDQASVLGSEQARGIDSHRALEYTAMGQPDVGDSAHKFTEPKH
jgi:hypothetical protein